MNILIASFAILSLLVPMWESVSVCTTAGTFRQPKDPTCQKYYICSTLYINGYPYLSGQQYQCAGLMKFNPTTLICDLHAVCIDSFCEEQVDGQALPDPNAVNHTCPKTYIKCVGTINQYPTIQPCPTLCC